MMTKPPNSSFFGKNTIIINYYLFSTKKIIVIKNQKIAEIKIKYNQNLFFVNK